MEDMHLTIYLCYDCRREVGMPGYMGRSWCRHCDSYNKVATVTHIRQRDTI